MRDSIDWLLGDEERSLRGVDPMRTVLEHLRLTERRIGTKEGCAEGDCGACTVILGEPVDGTMRYRAVNACILLLGALDGRQLLTVEDLRGPDGALHPVQQAMVDCHASQCGFCTPGFVMSAFALYHSEAPTDRASINDALAGNLCRCTGYRPIVDATVQACAGGRADQFSDRAQDTAARLTAMTSGKPALAVGSGECCYLAPRNLAELSALRQLRPDALLLAGGTDVGVWVAKQHREYKTIISLQAVRELGVMATTDTAIQIGAAVPYEDALAALGDDFPNLGRLIRRIGSRQIRNLGTIGGNIANGSPIGDTMPALIALGATLVLRRGAETRAVALEDFYTGYRQTDLARGEFIERIDIPRPRPDWMFATYKLSKRLDQDISAVCAGFAVRLSDGRVQDIRIAYGGMAATPIRARGTERSLAGATWTEASVHAAMRELAQECRPISDMRAGSAYRRQAAGNLLFKFFLETAGTHTARTRLLGTAA